MPDEKLDRPDSEAPFCEELERLREAENAHYILNQEALGRPSLELVTKYLELYNHLWRVATSSMPRPFEHANLFTHEMLIECRADLTRTMLLLMRTHLIEAHAQTRRAIECCAWARRVHQEPSLVEEWLSIDMQRAPSKAWRDNIKSSLLFPSNHPHLDKLRSCYQITSRCVHPFRFSFQGRTALEQCPDGTMSVLYSFFDAEDIHMQLPTRFLWTLQTHDLIFNVFEEIFAKEISVVGDEWKRHRTATIEALTEVGKMWIAISERAKARQQRMARK